MPQEMQNLFEQAFNPPPSKKKGKRKRAASWFDENPLEDGDLTMGEIVDEGIGLAINLFTGEGAERAEASAENRSRWVSSSAMPVSWKPLRCWKFFRAF